MLAYLSLIPSTNSGNLLNLEFVIMIHATKRNKKMLIRIQSAWSLGNLDFYALNFHGIALYFISSSWTYIYFFLDYLSSWCLQSLKEQLWSSLQILYGLDLCCLFWFVDDARKTLTPWPWPLLNDTVIMSSSNSSHGFLVL